MCRPDIVVTKQHMVVIGTTATPTSIVPKDIKEFTTQIKEITVRCQ
jgi:glycerol-3-phosphate dehydrogenase